MADEIEHKLRAWLSKSGFALEMRVAAALRAQGVEIRRGEYYTDPRHSDTRREIDVVASTRESGAHWTVAEIAVECKASPDTPWVVFTKAWPSGFDGWPGVAAQMSEQARAVRYGAANLWPAGPRVGYAVRPGFHERGKKDSAYEAVIQAVSYGEYFTGDGYLPSGAKGPERRAVLPCVVLDGDLFEAYLAPDGTMQIQRVKQVALECRQPASSAGFVAVVVVSAAHLDEFARAAVAWAKDVAARLAYNS